MSSANVFAWILMFSVGWALVLPMVASYESGQSAGASVDLETPGISEPDGSNPLSMLWDYLSWYRRVLTFDTTPATSFLTYFLFAPLSVVGIYTIVRG